MPIRWFRQRACRAALAGTALVAAACQGTATATSPIFTTDLVTGTVVTQAPGVNPLKTSISSLITVTLVSLDPDTGVAVGVGIGDPIPSTGGCTVVTGQLLRPGGTFQVDAATVGAAGNHCVEVLEYVTTDGSGAIPNPLTYVVKVNHH